MKCLTCPNELAPVLERLGAIQCHDCRGGCVAGGRSSRASAHETSVTDTAGAEDQGTSLERIHLAELEGSGNGAPVASFIVAGRCGCCGQLLQTWTPERVIAAAQAWFEEHGRSPTRMDWKRAGYGNPAATTVHAMFGTFVAFREAAGLPPAKLGPREPLLRWPKDKIAEAMLDWLASHGRWPTIREWENAGETHPCTSTVYRVFGNWKTAKRYAGWNGVTKRARHAPPAEVAA